MGRVGGKNGGFWIIGFGDMFSQVEKQNREVVVKGDGNTYSGEDDVRGYDTTARGMEFVSTFREGGGGGWRDARHRGMGLEIEFPVLDQ